MFEAPCIYVRKPVQHSYEPYKVAEMLLNSRPTVTEEAENVQMW